MADQRSIKSYFGAPVKQLKRKAKPSTESTVVNEKKKQRDNPPLPELPQIDSSSDSDPE